MEWLKDLGMYLLIAVAAFGALFFLYKYLGRKKMKELVYKWVLEAEKKYGGKAGETKYQYVATKISEMLGNNVSKEWVSKVIEEMVEKMKKDLKKDN